MAIGGGSAATVYVDVEGDLSKFRDDVAGAGDIAKKELGGSKMSGAGKAAGAALAAGAVGALVVGVQGALEKEQLELNFAASLGLDQTSAEFEALAETSTSLYRDAWGETIEDVNKVVADAYANFGDFATTDEIEAWSAQSIAIADTFGLSVEEIMTTAGTAFYSGLTADDPQEIFDAIVASAQQVPEGLRGEILAAGTEYSQFFSDLGFDSEEAFGILVSNAGDGAYGIDKAGDAIKEFTIRATDGSSASTEALALIGLEAGEMSNAILAGGDEAKGAFDQIVSGLLAIEDPTERANAAIALFGTPIEDLGVTDIPRFLEGLQSTETSLGDVEGAAQDVADTVGGSTQAKFESLKRKGMGVLVDFAEKSLIPALEAILPFLEGLAGAIEVLPTPIKSAGFATAIFGGSLLALSGPITRTMGLVKGFFTLVSANPYVLLILAGIALVVLIVKNWDTIKEYTVKAFNAVKDFLADWWPLLLGIFTGGIGLVVGYVIQNWDEVKGKTVEIWNGIYDFLSGILSGIGGFFEDKIIGPISTIVGWLADLPEKARNGFEGMKTALANVAEWIKTKLGEIRDAADRALGPIDEIIGGAARIGGGILGSIPGFDSGGVVPGPIGAPRLVLAHGGETFIPTHKRGMEGAAGDGSGGTVIVNLHDATIRSEDDVVRLARMLDEETRRVRRSKGGK